MKRRDFLAAIAGAPLLARRVLAADEHQDHATPAFCQGTYSSPEQAMRSARETLVYLPAIYTGTGIGKPDYLCTVDVNPQSGTYGKVVHRLEMPHVGDELHHFGWNACSSCYGDPTRSRRYLVLPGLSSSRIHIIDTIDAAAPRSHKVIEPEEIAKKTDLSSPHTVHLGLVSTPSQEGRVPCQKPFLPECPKAFGDTLFNRPMTNTAPRAASTMG